MYRIIYKYLKRLGCKTKKTTLFQLLNRLFDRKMQWRRKMINAVFIFYNNMIKI